LSYAARYKPPGSGLVISPNFEAGITKVKKKNVPRLIKYLKAKNKRFFSNSRMEINTRELFCINWIKENYFF